MTDAAHRPSPCSSRGYSLLETIIAIGILGVGLIMVAGIFPVALAEHRTSSERAAALELSSKAQAMLDAKINPSQIWPAPSGADSDVYLLPFPNIYFGGTWDLIVDAPVYSNWLNFGMASGNLLDLIGADILSDRVAPFDDNQAQASAGRQVWYAFYRRLAGGRVTYSIAVCGTKRGQAFIQQDTSPAPGLNLFPRVDASALRRFPTPWRVRVARRIDAVNPAHNVLWNDVANEGLAELAPPGTKLLIAGFPQEFLPTAPFPPAAIGRVLTVSDLIGPLPGVPTTSAVEVIGDISDLPDNDPSDGIGTGPSFYVWFFPPQLLGGDAGDARFGRPSPLIEWKVLP